MRKALNLSIILTALAIIMLGFVSANNFIIKGSPKGIIQNSVHFVKFQDKTISIKNNSLLSNSESSFSTVSNDITVIWPEEGYYYITDFMWLEVATNNNANCSYSLDSSEFKEMADGNATDHFQLITDLKDNMNTGPYVIDFRCIDEPASQSSASTYFWINVTDLDKYFLRNDFGQWVYWGSDKSWSENEDGLLEAYEALYEQKQKKLGNLIYVDIFDSENSIRSAIKKDLDNPNYSISTQKIGDRSVYVLNGSGFKEIFWNSWNNLIFIEVYSYDNSSSVSIDYPMEIITPYLQKYPGVLIEFCKPNWTGLDNKCQANNKKLISYSNTCEINGKVPLDNGTYVSCNYCSQNIQEFYTNWSACSPKGLQTRVKYYIDENYASCCAITGIGSDCSIKDSKYNNVTENSSCNSFVLTLNSPAKALYNTGSLILSINSSTKLSKLDYIDYTQKNPKWANLCKNCYSYNKIRKFSDGAHNLSIRANSTEGQTLFATSSFLIDSKIPKISLVLPSNKAFTNGSNFFIKYSEDNLKNITLFYGGDRISRGNCISGDNKNCSFNADLKKYNGKTINYRFRLTDIAGNIAESKNTSVLVDTTAPVILKFNYSISGKYVTFNMTINETNFKIINFIDVKDSKPKLTTLCSSLKNSACLVKSSFKAGNHSLIITAIDKAGNSDKESISFKV